MAVYNDEKLRAMEDEMNRFEEEIGLPIIPPPPPPPMGLAVPTVIGANTYNTVQRQLEEQQGIPGFVGIPPPPPPPPMLVPHQVRMRPPSIRHWQSGNSFIPPAHTVTSGIMSVNPMQPVVSATPMIYQPTGSESQVPLGMMDSGIMGTGEVSGTLPPMAVPPEPVIPSTPTIDPSIERRIKINKARMQAREQQMPVPPIHIPTNIPIPMMADESASGKKKKNRKAIRTAGGQTWEDHSLLEWEDDDFRLFCGDLGNDVTDEILIRVFSKYPSFLKAKVVRDKRTNKTKGFGFVSFKDPQDFIKAMKEMNGRYVGSRPIKLRKSTWKNRALDTVRKKDKEKAALIGLLTGR